MEQLNLFKFPKKDVGKNDKVVCITDGRVYRKPEEGKVVPILRIHRPREERLEEILHSVRWKRSVGLNKYFFQRT